MEQAEKRTDINVIAASLETDVHITPELSGAPRNRSSMQMKH
jgi:hypothetical protein